MPVGYAFVTVKTFHIRFDSILKNPYNYNLTMELLFNPITGIIITLGVLIYSAILHEIAHGIVADRLGDPTARLLGRITLDPRPHIDPMLSILAPLLLIVVGSPVIFGGAKPVPVDPFNLKEGRKDLALVSLAGPLTNVVIAVAGSLLFALLPTRLNLEMTVLSILQEVFAIQNPLDGVAFFLGIVVYINLLLALFNLLPIPPLDGSKIFAMILPERQAQAYMSLGSIGFLLIFFLLMFPIGPFSLGRLITSLLFTMLGLLSF